MKSVAGSLLALVALLALGLGMERLSGLRAAQEAPEGKKLVWKHGLNFQVRKAGEAKFDDKTQKFGCEIFLDRDINQLVYVAETGRLALGTAAKLVEGSEVKAPKLYHALEVRVRGAGEAAFTEKTRKFSTEVFRDVNTDNLVYVSEVCSLGVMPAAGISAPDKIKDPVWFHGLELKVRKAGEKEFSDTTRKVGLEVYKDENTNHLFYVTDAGRIAVVAVGSATKPAEVKGPTWFHAFEVKVRKADEKEFTKDTRMYGVEVYKDENANTLIYISETGDIAVVPAGGASKPESSKEPKWLHGRLFRVRKASEPDFNKDTQRFGAEIYKDENTGNRVYLTDMGALAAFTGK